MESEPDTCCERLTDHERLDETLWDSELVLVTDSDVDSERESEIDSD